MQNYALILASGESNRMNSDIPKQFIQLTPSKTILELSVLAFQNNPAIDHIITVVAPSYYDYCTKLLSRKSYSRVLSIIKGGKTRQLSAFNGIMSIDESECNVLIHDACRPFVRQRIINESISLLSKYPAVVTAIHQTDTIYKINNDVISSIPERNEYLKAQTPQSFKLSLIRNALTMAMKDQKTDFTDDAGIVMYYKLSEIHWIKGDETNIKITYPSDMAIAKTLYKQLNSKL